MHWGNNRKCVTNKLAQKILSPDVGNENFPDYFTNCFNLSLIIESEKKNPHLIERLPFILKHVISYLRKPFARLLYCSFCSGISLLNLTTKITPFHKYRSQWHLRLSACSSAANRWSNHWYSNGNSILTSFQFGLKEKRKRKDVLQKGG